MIAVFALLVLLVAALAAAYGDPVYVYAAETRLATVLRRLASPAERPVPYGLTELALLVLVDHVECEGGCGAVLCCCTRPGLCPDTVEQACTHLGLFCGDCRMPGCDECVIDAMFDAGALR